MGKQVDKRRVALMTVVVLIATLLVFVGLVTVSTRGLTGKLADTGDIVLSDVALRREAGELLLDARADFELPSTIRNGLNSGVPLNFIMTLRFLQPRRFWFDETVAQHQQRYSLNYYELTRHYRIESLNSDTSRNYRSLSSALDGLGQIDDLPVTLDTETLNGVTSKTLLAALDFRLDTSALPLPLQPLIASSWRLASEEVVWPVD